MKIINSAFLDKDLQIIKNDISSQNKWVSIQKIWNPELLKGIDDSFEKAEVSHKVSGIIRSKIVSYIPEVRKGNMAMMYHRFYANSGISCHIDADCSFAATIYLNEKWDIDWGGLYIWEDQDFNLQALIPTYNLMIINNKKLKHLVTPISKLAPEPRIAIQVFGVNIGVPKMF